MKTFLVAVTLLLACASGASAQTPDRLVGYLPAEAWADTAFAPPPSPGSPAERADRALWRETAALTDDADWRQAAVDDAAFGGRSPALMFACALGASLDDAAAPRLNALLRRTLIDVEAAAAPLKRRFARPRPYEGDAAARVCVSIPPQRRRGTATSYPSSSSTAGVVWADALRLVAPDREAAVRARGRQMGELRLACRLHYASDVEAGWRLGDHVSRRLAQTPAYLDDARRAAAEVAAARRTAPAPAGCPAGSE